MNIVVPFIFLALLAGVIFDGYFAYQDNRTRYWRQTEGIIHHLDIERIDSDGDFVGHKPIVSYSYYDASGVQFTGNSFHYFSDIKKKYKAAEKLVAQYGVGEKARVFYNPSAVGDSLLVPPASPRIPYFFASFVLIMLIMSISMFIPSYGATSDTAMPTDKREEKAKGGRANSLSGLSVMNAFFLFLTLAAVAALVLILYPKLIMTIPR